MTYPREMVVGFEPWRAEESGRGLRERIEARLRGTASVAPAFLPTPTGILVQRLTPAGVVACLDIGLRGDAWAAAVCLRATAMPRRTVPPVLVRARRLPTGLAVRADHRDPSVAHAAAVLQMHAAILRRRRPAAWRAIDAVARHGSCTAAAAALGLSVQAVSRQVRLAQAHATRHTAAILDQLAAAE